MPKQENRDGYYKQNENSKGRLGAVGAREYERKSVEDEQRKQVAYQTYDKRLGVDNKLRSVYPEPPFNIMKDDWGRLGGVNSGKPKDIDTPIPQLSPVKRAAKAAERQRMKTPGMGDVKSAERKQSQQKTVGSMLRNQMMKQQGKK